MASTQAAVADAAHTLSAQAATSAVTGQAAANVLATTAALAAAGAEVEMAQAAVLANLTSTNLAGTLAALAAAEAAAAVAAAELAVAETAAATGAAAATSATGPLLLVLGPLAIVAAATGAAMLAISAAAVVLGGAGAGGFIAVTKSAKDFEAIMKDVELQSGATADEMERIVDATLSVEMTSLGKSGSDAATMFRRLASEGFDVAQMQQMSLPITRTAINLGEDQAEVTKLMLNLMEQFNLEASDMVHISDVLTNALADTSFQGEELVEVMRFAGPAAGALNWNMQQTVAVTDALMKRFGVASMTGTRFVGVIEALRAPSGEAADEFERVGISLHDVARALESPTGLYELLGTAMERGANFSKLFERRAAAAARILAEESVPAMQAMVDGLFKAGTGIEFASEKSKTLAGSLDALAAAWESLKISLGIFTQALGTDYVMGLTLALEATVEFAKQIRELSGTHEQTAEEMMGRQQKFAETFIKTFFTVARAVTIAGFALIEYGKILRTILIVSAVLSPATAGPILAAAFALKKLSEVGWERGKQNAKEYLDEIDKVEAGIISALDTVAAKRLEIFAPTAEAPGRGPGAKPTLGKTIAQVEAELAARTAKIIEDQADARKELAFWAAHTNILADDAIQKAQIELAFRARDLEMAHELLAILVKRGATEDERQQAADEANQATLAFMTAQVALMDELADAAEEWADNVDKATRGWIAGHLAMAKAAKNLEMQVFWHRQIIFYLQQQAVAAAQANDWATWGKLQQEMARSQEAMFKLGDRERMKAARDFDKLVKQGDSVRDAIQAVIGGTLGQGIQAAIGRVSGAGLRKGLGAGAVRAVGTNEIRVVVDVAGLSDEGKRQITDHFIGVLEEGATQLPALAY